MDSLLYNDIRDSLIEYYSKQEEFKDFNWTAPAISTLIDAQAYLAYYLNTYANFALNESFLDTAIKRSSVVSKARNIGYFPTQYKASEASLKMTYTGSANLDNYIIPSRTVFSAKNEGTTYYFKTYAPALVQKTAAGRYWAQVYVREGTEVTNTWTQNSDLSVKFVLSNPKVDTSTIVVTVYDSVSDTIGTKYTLFDNILQFGPKATGYSIEENTDGNLELVFGDGILGKMITSGQIVKCTYLACSGEVANNIATFTLVSFPDSTLKTMQWSVESAASSDGGADRETIESIKLNAPRFFQRQGRNVTAEDYKADILKEYGSLINGISVWGGENNTPPQYGSVFISVKPKNGLSLSTLQKERIIDYIENTSVVGITVKIVDATALYVDMQLNLTYNPLYLKMTPNMLKEQTQSVVKSYFNNSLNSFNTEFRYSKFLSSVFNISDSIADIDMNLSLYQYFLPQVDVKTTYNIDFKNAIEPGTVVIGPYYDLTKSYDAIYMTDPNKDGILYEIIFNNYEQVGTVDYDSGVAIINTYSFGTNVGEQILATCKPANNNMSVNQNYVFSINTIDVALTETESKYLDTVKD